MVFFKLNWIFYRWIYAIEYANLIALKIKSIELVVQKLLGVDVLLVN